MSHIIAFTGRKYSGKDTAANALCEEFGAIKVRFADPIKEMLAVLLDYQGVDRGTIYRMVDGDLKETPSEFLQGKTPRLAMQTLGTEWGRNLIGEKLWTDAFFNRASDFELVVCSDLRFPNELEALKEYGSTTIRIVRPGLSDNEFSNHPSEQAIDNLDVLFEVHNDGTKDELIETIVSLYEEGLS